MRTEYEASGKEMIKVLGVTVGPWIRLKAELHHWYISVLRCLGRAGSCWDEDRLGDHVIPRRGPPRCERCFGPIGKCDCPWRSNA
jgi:hypothetical protein